MPKVHLLDLWEKQEWTGPASILSWLWAEGLREAEGGKRRQGSKGHLSRQDSAGQEQLPRISLETDTLGQAE